MSNLLESNAFEALLQKQQDEKSAFFEKLEDAKQDFLQKQQNEQFGHHQDQMSKLKKLKFEKIIDSLSQVLPYRPKVVVDFEADCRIQIGPCIAVSIIYGNEFALCYSIGDNDESFYNARGERKWSLFQFRELRYEDAHCVRDVKEELIRLIKCVYEHTDLVSQKVEEERKKYLKRRMKYLEKRKKSPFQ